MDAAPTPNGPRVLITGGPTAEDIDPVRFITNRSTGRMGVAVAESVLRAGGTARLILGPTAIRPPGGVETLAVRSAADMHRAVLEHFSWCQALIMTAAVADYTPAEPLDAKLKKTGGDLLLRLRRTVDILAAIRDLPERGEKVVGGFSLDVGMNVEEGRRKLRAKHLDFIVVNTVDSFGSGRERASIVLPAGQDDCGHIAKDDLADRIVALVLRRLQELP